MQYIIESNIKMPPVQYLSNEEFYEKLIPRKYGRWYRTLMERSFDRNLDSYVERHHIIPRCLGGRFNKTNIAKLTAREHYVAHQLLVKLFKGNCKIATAAQLMTTDSTGRRVDNKLYGWLRTQLSESLKDRKFSDETRAKMSKAWKTRVVSDETKALMSVVSKGNQRRKNILHTEESKLKMSKSRKFENLSKETRCNKSSGQTKRVAKLEPYSNGVARIKGIREVSISRFVVKVIFNRTVYNLGTFYSLEEAIEKQNAKRRELESFTNS